MSHCIAASLLAVLRYPFEDVETSGSAIIVNESIPFVFVADAIAPRNKCVHARRLAEPMKLLQRFAQTKLSKKDQMNVLCLCCDLQGLYPSTLPAGFQCPPITVFLLSYFLLIFSPFILSIQAFPLLFRQVRM